MPTTGVQLEGLPEVQRSLRRFGVDVQDMRAPFTDVGRVVTDLEQQLVPRRSGALAATIAPVVGRNRVEVLAGQGLVYAGVIHYGWAGHNIEPQPFATDAIARTADTVPRLLEAGVGDLINKHGLT